MKVFGTDGLEMEWDSIVTPITDMMDSLLVPTLWLVGSIGAIYCVIVGVKFAKANDPQEREKAKNALKNSTIGFLVIFILIALLRTSVKPLAHWVKQIGEYYTSDDKIDEDSDKNENGQNNNNGGSGGYSPGEGVIPEPQQPSDTSNSSSGDGNSQNSDQNVDNSGSPAQGDPESSSPTGDFDPGDLPYQKGHLPAYPKK